MYPPYIAMDIFLIIAFVRADWYAIGAAVRKREGISEAVVDEGDIEESLISNDAKDYGSIQANQISC